MRVAREVHPAPVESYERNRGEQALLIRTELRTVTLPNAGDLAAIGGLYAAVRFVLANLYLVAGAAVVLLLALLSLVWCLIRRALQ